MLIVSVMILESTSHSAGGDGVVEYRVAARFTPDEARRLHETTDLIAMEGIPLEVTIDAAGVSVWIDTPLQIAGCMIADEDLSARFRCRPEKYREVMDALEAYLRAQLAPIWRAA